MGPSRRSFAPRFIRIASWRLSAPVDRVWAVLADLGGWPAWWPDLRAVRALRTGGADGIGAVHAFDWRSGLGYRLRLHMETVRASPLRDIEALATGDLTGQGLWLLRQVAPDVTDVTYRWDVRLERPWMRVAAPIAGRVFAWSHATVMRRGARGMARVLGCEVSGFSDCASVTDKPPARSGPAVR